DVVAEDAFVYENSGVDYLTYDAAGAPIFLAVDGRSERVLQDDARSQKVMLPLYTGAHSVRVQSTSRGSLGAFGGRMSVPVPSYPLTTSESSITVGLPSHVRPIAFTGGERTTWFVHVVDLVAVCGGALLA